MGGEKRSKKKEKKTFGDNWAMLHSKKEDNGMKWNEKGRNERLKMQQCNQGSTFKAFGEIDTKKPNKDRCKEWCEDIYMIVLDEI